VAPPDDERRQALTLQGMAPAYWAGVEPDRPALVDPDDADQSRSSAQLNARVNQLVRGLRAAGLREGDGVVALVPNRAAFVETYWACLRAGWRFTPVNWHLGADDVGYIVADAGARAFVVDAELAAVGRAAAGQVPSLVAPLATGGPIDGFGDYDQLLAAQDPSDIDDPVPGFHMLYTSGTTGRPKGVHRDAPPTLAVDPAIYPPGHVHLLTGPLYHAAPLQLSLHPTLSAGGTLVVMQQWDAERTLALIDQHQVTHTHVVPTMFHRLLALPADTRERHDVSSLRIAVHGAAPCPVHVKQRMLDWWGPVIWEYYAATEGAGSLVDPHTWLAHPGTVGRPLDSQVIVGDDEAQPLPPGEPGLLWLRSTEAERFRYRNDEAKTRSAYRGDYFTLGDVGYFDADGYLFLTDRSAHLIISGGVNVYPAAVDAVLLEHPAVADVATIGVPDEEWGESVLAVVQAGADVEPGRALEAELIEFCRERLAHFMCPKAVDFVAELPRQDNGKIAKVRLRDAYRAAATSSRRPQDHGCGITNGSDARG
jgi:long-chain acyl-CoA synthetase